MLTCSMLTCLMVFFHGVRDRAETADQLKPHAGADQTAWIRAMDKKVAVHVKGPFWSSGLALHHSAQKAVWVRSGPSGYGSTVGVGVTVDF